MAPGETPDGVAPSYLVVWQEASEGPVAGKLIVEQDRLRLEGAQAGRSMQVSVPLDEVVLVRIGRLRDEQLDGRPTIVLERKQRPLLRVQPLGFGLLAELADLLATISGEQARQREAVVVVLPLKPGCVERARTLVAGGPPFDPAAAEIEHHEVFVTDREAVFVFTGTDVRRSLAHVLRDPALWRAGLAWRDCLDGAPRLADAVYAWAKKDVEVTEPGLPANVA